KVRSNLPLYEEFMNDDWDRKWGHVWCITFLNQEFENFRFKYIGRLAGPFALLDLGKRPNEPKMAKLRRYWCSFVVNFICNEKLLKMLWWTTMKLRVKSLKQAANPE
ncbi:hypothetical protein, partial [Vibrio parahaemolyticus]|uniref:hypothetical protein n=1 Tax=Vibrio parahaemolyticus TaxID=670 RepID=UPI001171CDC0